MQTRTDVSNTPSFSNFDSYPDSAQVRMDVVRKLLAISNSTAWRMVRAKKLRAYKLTERTTTFNVGELRALLADKAGV